MAIQVRQPPGFRDTYFREREAFDESIHRHARLVGQVTVDLGSIAAAAKATITIPVIGARPNVGQTVSYGLPSTWSTDLRVITAVVTAKDTVVLTVENRSGGPIDPASATYYVRVFP